MKATSLAKALVAHASAYLPGDEELDIASVRDIILTMAEDPLSKVALDRELTVVNDPDTIALVRNLIQRVISDLEKDARAEGHRNAISIQPWQAASATASVGILIGAVAGTISIAWALPGIALALAGAVVTTMIRMRLAKTESELQRKADLAKSLL